MRIFSRRPLREFWLRFPDSEQQLLSWYRETNKAEWENPNDIKTLYKSASILKSNRVVFNICGNKYRLIVEIDYRRRGVFVRFIGTHKEYDAIDANKI